MQRYRMANAIPHGKRRPTATISRLSDRSRIDDEKPMFAEFDMLRIAQFPALSYLGLFVHVLHMRVSAEAQSHVVARQVLQIVVERQFVHVRQKPVRVPARAI